jgi:ATP-binding cassette subfamily B protein
MNEPRRGERVVVDAVRLAWRAAPGWVAVHMALSVVGAAVPVVVAWLTKLVLDQLGGPEVSGAAVAALAAGLGAAGLVAAGVPQADQYARAEVERRVAVAGQETLFGAVDRIVGLGPFEDPEYLDRLRLAQQACRDTPSQVVDGMLGILRGCVTGVGFIGSLLVLSPGMAAVVLAAAVPALVAERSLARRRAQTLWSISPAERKELMYGSLLVEAHSAKEVRLLGIGPVLLGRMLSHRRQVNAAHRRLDRRELVVQGGLGLLSAAVAGVGLVLAVLSARTGGLTIGDVAMFVASVAAVQGALGAVIGAYADMHHSVLMFGHYVAVTSAPPDLPVRTSARPAAPLREAIELRDIWFRYSDEHPWVLRGVNLTIPHGESVALVGFNGAGKSTLIKLLCRLYDPTRGVILWDGVDLRDLDPASLRERIGIAFQDFVRYELTAEDNVALGDASHRMDTRAVAEAAHAAGVHETIAALPRRYQTLLSRAYFAENDEPDPGVVLSGGQWQRVALARSFTRIGRDLLILDEPSSGLDAEAEYDIHRRLRMLRSGMTSLLISHRLGAVRGADVIVVIADGTVIEQGDHASLIASGGAYARLFRLQAAGYQEHAPEEVPSA